MDAKAREEMDAKALGRASRQTPFSPVELSKSLFKGFGIQKGPSLPFLGYPTGENHRHL